MKQKYIRQKLLCQIKTFRSFFFFCQNKQSRKVPFNNSISYTVLKCIFHSEKSTLLIASDTISVIDVRQSR